MDALASTVGSDGSIPELVAGWARTIERDEAFQTLLYQTSLQAHLAGELMVRGVELEEEAADGLPGTVALTGRSAREAARDFAQSFLAMPFEEALAFFRAKRVLSEAEFDALLDRYKRGGFIARRLASERLQEVARSAVERLLAQGLTREEAARAIRDAEASEAASLGIAPASPAYLENIVRTNVATAYGAGRYAAMNDPAVVALRPYRQFWSAGDSRVRPGHRALHGLVFDAAGELAARYAPPLYYQCRCSMTTLSKRQLEARGLSVTRARVAAIEAEGFWTGAPGPLTEG